ncbi:Hypothetical protein GLP15_687 [Giardia lamblia P15]|uniref:Uncharacterized protein n=1 Tax=Giardia intestinalis (strain P15) TaxID=658858 RepID=E1F418_GIAIA|nr:Hypothetical protein GLP15_687 [Giardia lamblia P15]
MFLRDRLVLAPVNFNKRVVDSVIHDIELNLAALPLDLVHLNSCLAPPGPRVVCLTCRSDNQLELCLDCFTQGQHEGHAWFLIPHSTTPCANGLLCHIHEQMNTVSLCPNDPETFLHLRIPHDLFTRLIFATEVLLYHVHLSNNAQEVINVILRYPIYHVLVSQVCCTRPTLPSLLEYSSPQTSTSITQYALNEACTLLVHTVVQSLEDFFQLINHSTGSVEQLHEAIKKGYSFLEFYVLCTHAGCLPLNPASVDTGTDLHALYSMLASDSTSFPCCVFKLWPFIVLPLVFTTSDLRVCRALLFDDAFCSALQSDYFSDLFYTLTREPCESLMYLAAAYRLGCKAMKSFTNIDLAHVQLVQSLLVRWIVLIFGGPEKRNSEFLQSFSNYLCSFSTCSPSQQCSQVAYNGVPQRMTVLEQLFFLVYEGRHFPVSVYIVSQLVKAIRVSAVLLPLENSAFYDSVSRDVLDSALLYIELLRLVSNKFAFVYRKVSGEHASAADPSRQSLALMVDHERALFHPTLHAVHMIFMARSVDLSDLMDTTLRLLLNQTLHGRTNLCAYLYNQELKAARGCTGYTYPAIFLAAIHNAYEYSANYRTIFMAAQVAELTLDPLFVNRLRTWSGVSEDGYALSGLRFPSLSLYSSLLHACLVKYLASSSVATTWSFARAMHERLLLQTNCFSWQFVDKIFPPSILASDEVFDIVKNQADTLLKAPYYCDVTPYTKDCQSERIASVVFLEILSILISISLVYRMAFGAYARNGEDVTVVATFLISCYRPKQMHVWHKHISLLQLLIFILVSKAEYGSLDNDLSSLHNPVNCCLLGILVSFGLISRGFNSLYTHSSSIFNQSYLPLLAIELDRRRFMTQTVELIPPLVDGELGNMHALHPEPATLFSSLYEGALILLLQLIFVTHNPYLTVESIYIQSLVAVYVALNRTTSPSSLILELSEQFSDPSVILEAIKLVCSPKTHNTGFSAEVKLTTSGWHVLEPLLVPLELDRVHSAFTDSEALQDLRILPVLVSPQCNEDLLSCFASSKYFADLLFACIDLYSVGYLRHCCFLHLLRLLVCISRRCVTTKFLVPTENITQMLSYAHRRMASSAGRLLFDPMARILVEYLEESFRENSIAYSSMLCTQASGSATAFMGIVTKRKSPQAIKIKLTRTLKKLMADHHIMHVSSSGGTKKEYQSTEVDVAICCICLESLPIDRSLVYKTQLCALSELDVQLLNQLQAVPLQIIRSNFLYIAFRKHACQLGETISNYPPRVWPELSVFDLNPHIGNTSSHISHHSTGYTYLLDITADSILIPYVEQLAEEEHAGIIISVFTASSTELFSLLSASCTHIQHVSCMLRKDESEVAELLVCPVCSFPYITGIPLFRDILMQPSIFWSSSNYKMHNFILVELVFPLLIRILHVAHSSHGTKRFFPNTDELKAVLSSDPFLLGMILFLIHFTDCNLQSLLFLPKCQEMCAEPSLSQLFLRVISDVSRIFAVLLYLLQYIWVFDTRIGKKPFVQAVDECLVQLGERAVLSMCIIWEMAVDVSKELQRLGEQATTPTMENLSQCLTRTLKKLISNLINVGSVRNYTEVTAVPYNLLLVCLEATIYEALCPGQFSDTYVYSLKRNIQSYLNGGQLMALNATFSIEACSFQAHVVRIAMKSTTTAISTTLRPATFNLLCPLALADTAFHRLKLTYSSLGRNKFFLDSVEGKVCIYCGLPISDEQESLFIIDKLVEDGFCRCWSNEFFESPFCASRYVRLEKERYVLEPYEDGFGFVAPGGGCFMRLNRKRLSIQILSLIYGGLLEDY